MERRSSLKSLRSAASPSSSSRGSGSKARGGRSQDRRGRTLAHVRKPAASSRSPVVPREEKSDSTPAISNTSKASEKTTDEGEKAKETPQTSGDVGDKASSRPRKSSPKGSSRASSKDHAETASTDKVTGSIRSRSQSSRGRKSVSRGDSKEIVDAKVESKDTSSEKDDEEDDDDESDETTETQATEKSTRNSRNRGEKTKDDTDDPDASESATSTSSRSEKSSAKNGLGGMKRGMMRRFRGRGWHVGGPLKGRGGLLSERRAKLMRQGAPGVSYSILNGKKDKGAKNSKSEAKSDKQKAGVNVNNMQDLLSKAINMRETLASKDFTTKKSVEEEGSMDGKRGKKRKVEEEVKDGKKGVKSRKGKGEWNITDLSAEGSDGKSEELTSKRGGKEEEEMDVEEKKDGGRKSGRKLRKNAPDDEKDDEDDKNTADEPKTRRGKSRRSVVEDDKPKLNQKTEVEEEKEEKKEVKRRKRKSELDRLALSDDNNDDDDEDEVVETFRRKTSRSRRNVLESKEFEEDAVSEVSMKTDQDVEESETGRKKSSRLSRRNAHDSKEVDDDTISEVSMKTEDLDEADTMKRRSGRPRKSVANESKVEEEKEEEKSKRPGRKPRKSGIDDEEGKSEKGDKKEKEEEKEERKKSWRKTRRSAVEQNEEDDETKETEEETRKKPGRKPKTVVQETKDEEENEEDETNEDRKDTKVDESEDTKKRPVRKLRRNFTESNDAEDGATETKDDEKDKKTPGRKTRQTTDSNKDTKEEKATEREPEPKEDSITRRGRKPRSIVDDNESTKMDVDDDNASTSTTGIMSRRSSIRSVEGSEVDSKLGQESTTRKLARSRSSTRNQIEATDRDASPKPVEKVASRRSSIRSQNSEITAEQDQEGSSSSPPSAPLAPPARRKVGWPKGKPRKKPNPAESEDPVRGKEQDDLQEPEVKVEVKVRERSPSPPTLTKEIEDTEENDDEEEEKEEDEEEVTTTTRRSRSKVRGQQRSDESTEVAESSNVDDDAQEEEEEPRDLEKDEEEREDKEDRDSNVDRGCDLDMASPARGKGRGRGRSRVKGRWARGLPARKKKTDSPSQRKLKEVEKKDAANKLDTSEVLADENVEDRVDDREDATELEDTSLNLQLELDEDSKDVDEIKPELKSEVDNLEKGEEVELGESQAQNTECNDAQGNEEVQMDTTESTEVNTEADKVDTEDVAQVSDTKEESQVSQDISEECKDTVVGTEESKQDDTDSNNLQIPELEKISTEATTDKSKDSIPVLDKIDTSDSNTVYEGEQKESEVLETDTEAVQENVSQNSANTEATSQDTENTVQSGNEEKDSKDEDTVPDNTVTKDSTETTENTVSSTEGTVSETISGTEDNSTAPDTVDALPDTSNTAAESTEDPTKVEGVTVSDETTPETVTETATETTTETTTETVNEAETTQEEAKSETKDSNIPETTEDVQPPLSEDASESISTPSEDKTEEKKEEKTEEKTVEEEKEAEVKVDFHDATEEKMEEKSEEKKEETEKKEKESTEELTEQLYNADTDDGEVLDDTAAPDTAVQQDTEDAKDTEVKVAEISEKEEDEEKVPDANGNLEKSIDEQTEDVEMDTVNHEDNRDTDSIVSSELGNHMEEHPVETPAILNKISHKRGKNGNVKGGKRRKSRSPGGNQTGGVNKAKKAKKRGELELLYDVSGPPSKRSRTVRSVFLQEVQEVVRPVIEDANKEKDAGLGGDKVQEDVEGKSGSTVGVAGERKIQTRGKKNRYWYTFAKQSKSLSPMYLSKPDNADLSEMESFRSGGEKGEKRSRPNTPLDVYSNVPGDQIIGGTERTENSPAPSKIDPLKVEVTEAKSELKFEPRAEFRASLPPPEKRARTESPVPKFTEKIPSPPASEPGMKSHSPKHGSGSVSPHSKTISRFSGPEDEMLQECQPCFVKCMDFLKAIDLIKHSQSESKPGVRKLKEHKAKDQEPLGKKSSEKISGDSTDYVDSDATIDHDKSTSDEIKDERKVPPLRIKLSAIKGNKHAKEGAKDASKESTHKKLLTKTFVVNNRSSSPSSQTISLGDAEQSVKALDIHMRSSGQSSGSGQSPRSDSSPSASISNSAPTQRTKHTARKQVPRAGSLKFQCKKCTYTTNVRGNMQDHIYNHTSVVPYSCGHCSAIFGTRSGVMVHTKRDHRGRPYSVIKDNEINEEDFYTETRVLAKGTPPSPHHVTSLGDSSAPEKLIPNKSTPSSTTTTATTTPNLKCVHCAFATSDLATIQSHVSLHKDKDRRYVCPLCDLAYCKYADGMVKHFQKWHPNQKVILQYQPDYYDTTKDISGGGGGAAKVLESSPKSDGGQESDSLKGILETPSVKPGTKGLKMTARKSMKSPPQNIILKVPTLNNMQQRNSAKSKPAAKPIKPATSASHSPSPLVPGGTGTMPTPTSAKSTKTLEIRGTTKETNASIEIEVTGMIPKVPIFVCKFCPSRQATLKDILSHLDSVHHKVFVLACPHCPFSCTRMYPNIVRHIKLTHLSGENADEVNVKVIDEHKLFTRVFPPAIGATTSNKPLQKSSSSNSGGALKPTDVVDLDSSGEDDVYFLKGGKRAPKKHATNTQDGASDKSSTYSEEDSVMVQRTAPTVITVGPAPLPTPIEDMPLDMSVPSKGNTAADSKTLTPTTMTQPPKSDDITILRQPGPMPSAPRLTRAPQSAHGGVSATTFQAQRLQPPPLIPLGVVDGSVRSRLAPQISVSAPVAVSAPVPQTITIEPPPAHSHPPAKPSPTILPKPIAPAVPKPPQQQQQQQHHQPPEQQHQKQPQQHQPLQQLQQIQEKKPLAPRQPSRPSSPDDNDPGAIKAFSVFNLGPRMRAKSGHHHHRVGSGAGSVGSGIGGVGGGGVGGAGGEGGRSLFSSQPPPQKPPVAPKPRMPPPPPAHPVPQRYAGSTVPVPSAPTSHKPAPAMKIHSPVPRHGSSTSGAVGGVSGTGTGSGSAALFSAYMADPVMAQQIARMTQQHQQQVQQQVQRSLSIPASSLSSPAMVAVAAAAAASRLGSLPPSLAHGPPNVVVRPGMGFPRAPPPPLDRIYSCPYCPWTAPDQDTLHNHILTHEPNIQWTCPYCQMPNQMSKGFVEKHIKSCHPGKRVVYIPFGIQL